MAEVNLREEIRRLNVAERIFLAEEIWDSIAENQEAVAVTQAQKVELDRRIDSYNRSPEEGSHWQEVKARVQKSK